MKRQIKSGVTPENKKKTLSRQFETNNRRTELDPRIFE